VGRDLGVKQRKAVRGSRNSFCAPVDVDLIDRTSKPHGVPSKMSSSEYPVIIGTLCDGTPRFLSSLLPILLLTINKFAL
jgi:hypothetical protein